MTRDVKNQSTKHRPVIDKTCGCPGLSIILEKNFIIMIYCGKSNVQTITGTDSSPSSRRFFFLFVIAQILSRR